MRIPCIQRRTKEGFKKKRVPEPLAASLGIPGPEPGQGKFSLPGVRESEFTQKACSAQKAPAMLAIKENPGMPGHVQAEKALPPAATICAQIKAGCRPNPSDPFHSFWKKSTAVFSRGATSTQQTKFFSSPFRRLENEKACPLGQASRKNQNHCLLVKESKAARQSGMDSAGQLPRAALFPEEKRYLMTTFLTVTAFPALLKAIT